MTARTSRCPSGHTNSAGQKFCGECGVSLIGVCPSGHLNPEGHRYCGHCGLPLGGVGGSQTPPAGDPQPQSQIDQDEDEDDEDYEDEDYEDEDDDDDDDEDYEDEDDEDDDDEDYEDYEDDEDEDDEDDDDEDDEDDDDEDEDYEDEDDDEDEVPPGGVGTPPLKAGLGGLKSLWAKLPIWGKAVAVVGVLLAVSLTLANIGGRDKESYVFGYQRGSSGLVKDWVRGTSDGAKKTCERNVDYWLDLLDKKGIDRGDAVEGCVDAVNGRPLGPG